MMKIIKINTDHYVVVDETIQPVNGYYYDSFINKIKNTNGAEYGEASHCWQITHSTQPLDTIILKNRDHSQSVGHYYGDGGQLSLEEVKELIGEVDVEKKIQSLKNNFGYSTDDYYQGAEDGYNQSLEDNKEKKYTEDDLAEAILRTIDACNKAQKDSYGELEIDEEAIIQSLQPKTEWEVEIVDGKLKLK